MAERRIQRQPCQRCTGHDREVEVPARDPSEGERADQHRSRLRPGAETFPAPEREREQEDAAVLPVGVLHLQPAAKGEEQPAPKAQLADPARSQPAGCCCKRGEMEGDHAGVERFDQPSRVAHGVNHAAHLHQAVRVSRKRGSIVRVFFDCEIELLFKQTRLFRFVSAVVDFRFELLLSRSLKRFDQDLGILPLFRQFQAW